MPERRRHPRITLRRPLRGAVGSTRIYVMDTSISGLRVAHSGALPQPREFCRIELPTDLGAIKLDCEVIRTVLEKDLFHSGVAIVAADHQSTERLRSIYDAELKKREN